MSAALKESANPKKSKSVTMTLVVLFVVIGILSALALGAYAWSRGTISRTPGSSSEMSKLIPTGSVAAGSARPLSSLPPDARAFIIVKHEKHGFLVLTAMKERKGAHGQLSGGRIDIGEDGIDAAVREFFEETGILVNRSRIKPLWPIGNKHFFFLEITDADQVKGGTQPNTGESFRLKLSEEHISFSFYSNIHDASKAVLRHSGGTPADALEKFAAEDKA